METAPDFQLPEYMGLPVKRQVRSVTDEDVVKALDALRQPRATYQTVTRPIQAGDIAVVNYAGTCDGKPISEIAPGAGRLSEQKAFWLAIEPGWFVPGFTEQLIGGVDGEKRTVTVDFPGEFPTTELAGKKGVYAVEVIGVKEKVLPAVDEEFAKSYGAESMEMLKTGVRKDLENELEFSQSKDIRNQIVRALMENVNFELPETALAHETRNVVYDIVQENSKRGITRDVIEKQKEQIFSAATQGAKGRLKVAFLLQKIAEKEGIKVSDAELSARVIRMAQTYQIPPERFAKDLKKRNGLIEIFDQIMNEKVLDMLQKNAKVEEIAPVPAPAALPEPGAATPAEEAGNPA